MLFRPNFCANCGEKIERSDWGVFTSRRFCPVCETQFKGHDLIPRAIVAGGIVIGVLGVGSYLKSGASSTNGLAVRQAVKAADQQQRANTDLASKPGLPPTAASSPPQQIATLVQPVQPPEKSETDEPAYFCGAETKKGTPCSRRVKGNVRCYQHAGMPAMASADKLRIR